MLGTGSVFLTHLKTISIALNKSILLCAIFLTMGCTNSSNETYVPKPKGYQRIDLPPHAYQDLPDEHPYQFRISKYARVLPDSFAPSEPHWIFVDYPKHKANIQLTYKQVRNNPKLLAEYIDDSYKLAAKHQTHATAIQEQIITTPNGYTVTLFRLLGDVPSPYQFYTTDSVRHFLRGSIYFPAANKNDSIAPVVTYIKTDMLEMINTLRWKE